MKSNPSISLDDITFRTSIKSGDIGILIYMHGVIYNKECSYDLEFEGYVCDTFSEFAKEYNSDKDKLILAEYKGNIIGSIAVIGRLNNQAQIRWFLIEPKFRGIGLGWKLIDKSLEFCKIKKYSDIYLLTTSEQEKAIYMYTKRGFKKTMECTQNMWGKTITEERYDLHINY